AEQRTSFSATDGASIQIASLTDARGTQFLLDGSGSLVLTQLQTLIDSQLILRDNDLTLSQLASANRSEFDIAGAQLALPLIDSLRDGAITVGSDGVFAAPQLTNIDGTDLHVRGGATLSLPGVTGYRHLGDASSIDRSWSASGAGSRLELPNLSSILGGWGYNNDHVIQADDGAVIALPAVQQLIDEPHGDLNFRSFEITASGLNSRIELDALISIVDRNGSGPGQHSSIDASGGGEIIAPKLANLRGTQTTIDSAGDIDVAKLVTIEDSAITIDSRPSDFDALQTITGTRLVLSATDARLNQITRFEQNTLVTDSAATVAMPGVGSIDGSSFQAYGGTRIAFPQIESYDLATTQINAIRSWIAEGPGSHIDLSGLRWIRGGTESGTGLDVEAVLGGSVNLRNVIQVVDPTNGNTSGRRMTFTADGSGSLIQLDTLANVIDRNGNALSALTESAGGQITAPELATVINTTVTSEPIGPPPAASLRATESTGPDAGANRLISNEHQPFGASLRATASTDDAPPPPESIPSFQTIVWIGGDGNWNDPTNWDAGIVPGIFDDVELSVSGATATISGDHVVRSIHGPGGLNLIGGSLTVTAESTLTGPFNLGDGGTLAVEGPHASLIVEGPQSIDGGNLRVDEGAELVFKHVTRYDVAATANNTQRNWIVQGRGSRLVFESLQAINGGTHYGNRLTIEAHSGGHIDLAAVTQIAAGAEGNTARRGVSILA
ncbi:hypothetical protein, partial [Stieleria sp.]|uniref:hypothetical protein n=1 Tax=Stieleria sp. TaxID=2795976 RepID=UPI003568337A